MIVYIVSFAEHHNKKFLIKDGKLTLLHGPIGSGKSTLILAIRWAIYGGAVSGKNYEVQVTYKKHVIRRISKPHAEKFFTLPDGQILTGDHATEAIEKLIGPEHLFDLCCVINSRVGHTLLEGNKSNKLYYLTKLAFRDREDPIVLIEKIRKRMKETKNTYKLLLRDYNRDNSVLGDEIESKKHIIDDRVRNTSKEEIETSLINIKERLAMLNKRSWEYKHTMERLKVLSNTIDNLDSEIRSMTSTLEALDVSQYDTINKEVDETTIELQKLQNIHDKLVSKIDTLQTELSTTLKYAKEVEALNNKNRIRKLLPLTIPSNFGHNDLYTLQRRHDQYSTYKTQCSNIGCEYTHEAIKKTIAYYESVIVYNKKKETYNRYTQLVEQHDSIVLESLTELETLYYEMKTSTEVLTCPECDSHLRYISGNLVVHKKPVYTKKDIDELSAKIKGVKKLQLEKSRLSSLIKELGNVKGFKVNDEYETETNISDKLSLLRKIEVVSLPSLTVEEGKLLLEYYSVVTSKTPNNIRDTSIIEQELLDAKKVLGDNNNELRDAKSLLVELKNRLNKLTSLIIKKNTLTVKVDVLVKQLASVTLERDNLLLKDSKDVEEEISSTINEQSNLKDLLGKRIWLDTIRSRSDALKKQCDEITTMGATVAALIRLYKNATAEHYSHLNGVVNNINSTVREYIGSLFTEPITVSFVLHTVNHKKQYQNSVKLNIIKNGVPTKIENVSFGQMELISLLILIALNNVYQGPIILLDEAMSRLDSDTRLKCFSAIRRTLKGRTILSAEHHAEEDDYDENISFWS